MKFTISEQRCSGHGLCHDSAPDLVTLDSDGRAGPRDTEIVVNDSKADALNRMVAICPERAIERS